MKKRALCLLMAGLMCVSLAGCGSSDSGKETTKAAEGGAAEESKEAGNEESKDGLKVCIVYTGNLGDKSYNDSCNIGAQKAVEDFGIELKSLEGTTAQEWEANLVAACEGGYDLIIGASSNIADYISKHAPNYPDTKFAVIDTTVDLPNVESISFAQNQGSFLAGAAAAMFTQKTDIEGVNEDNVIGWVGGMDIPVLHDFYVGYEQGAKYIDPDITILQAFAGTWTDPLKGKELTLAQYEQGADIVMNVASGTGPGILEAAKEAGKSSLKIYGVDGSPEMKSELTDEKSMIAGTGAQSPINVGKQAAKIGEAILNDEDYEKTTYIDTFFIGKDNVEMYGTNGWQ